MLNDERTKIIHAKTAESAAMVANVRRAMAIAAKLNRLTFDDADQVRALFSELIGRQVDDSFLLIPFYTAGQRNPRRAQCLRQSELHVPRSRRPRHRRRRDDRPEREPHHDEPSARSCAASLDHNRQAYRYRQGCVDCHRRHRRRWRDYRRKRRRCRRFGGHERCSCERSRRRQSRAGDPVDPRRLKCFARVSAMSSGRYQRVHKTQPQPVVEASSARAGKTR